MSKALCPQCGSGALRPQYKPRGTARGLTVHICGGCGLVQSLPRDARPPKRAARVSGGADWGNIRYGKAFRIADTMAALSDALRGRTPRRILDIGSNRGAFVEAAWDRWPGAAITAIEPDERVVDGYAGRAGLTLHHAPVERVQLPRDAFDLVHCSHTLEHLADPIAVLRDIALALAPDGLAYLEVPNLATVGRADMVEEWFIDKHLYHFSATTLGVALGLAGLHPIGEIDRGLHLAALARRGPWRDAPYGENPQAVAKLLESYARGLAGNRRALVEAAERIGVLAQERRVAIWGAGRILDSLVTVGGLDLAPIVAVIDRHLREHADSLHGVPLLAPDALRAMDIDAVIIASREFATEIARETAVINPGIEAIPYAALLTPLPKEVEPATIH